jgi:4-amino-4-deoxy-L-arabinose transferase-like glycosyltransferase
MDNETPGVAERNVASAGRILNRDGRELRFVLLLSFMAALLYTFGSARLPFLGSDEPRYAQVAKEMLQSREYLLPRLAGLPWYEKPVMLYWLLICSYKIFGVSEFSSRLPSALAALTAVLTIYATVRTATDWKRGIVSSLALATSVFFVVFSHAATFDMLLTCCITMVLCSFLLYEVDHNKKFFLYAMYVAAGLGVLAKGFVALIIPALSILTYLIISGSIKEVSRLKPLIGLLIVAVVSGIWFLPISLISGTQFWNVFFYQHHVGHFIRAWRRSEGVLFYIPVFLLGTYPWTVAPFLATRSARTGPAKILTRLALCWLFSTLLFFSFSKSQLPSYVLPAVPPFGILAGLAIIDYFEKAPRNATRMILLVALINAFPILAIIWLFRKFSLPGSGVIAFMIAVEGLTAISLILAVKGRFVIALSTYAMIAFAGLAIFVYVIFPRIPWTESKMLSLAIKPRLTGNRKLVEYNLSNYVPLFYTDGRVELIPDGHLYTLNDPQQLYRYVSRKKEAYLLVDNNDLEWIRRVRSWKISNIIPGHELSVLELGLKPRKHRPPAADHSP